MMLIRSLGPNGDSLTTSSRSDRYRAARWHRLSQRFRCLLVGQSTNFVVVGRPGTGTCAFCATSRVLAGATARSTCTSRTNRACLLCSSPPLRWASSRAQTPAAGTGAFERDVRDHVHHRVPDEKQRNTGAAAAYYVGMLSSDQACSGREWDRDLFDNLRRHHLRLQWTQSHNSHHVRKIKSTTAPTTTTHTTFTHSALAVVPDESSTECGHGVLSLRKVDVPRPSRRRWCRAQIRANTAAIVALFRSVHGTYTSALTATRSVVVLVAPPRATKHTRCQHDLAH